MLLLNHGANKSAQISVTAVNDNNAKKWKVKKKKLTGKVLNADIIPASIGFDAKSHLAHVFGIKLPLIQGQKGGNRDIRDNGRTCAS